MTPFAPRCNSSRGGDVVPSREHHERWVIQQLADCRAAYEQRTPPEDEGTRHPNASDTMRHALYMVSTFEARYPRIAREGRELTLTIDRSDVLNSTVSNRENTIVQCFH